MTAQLGQCIYQGSTAASMMVGSKASKKPPSCWMGVALRAIGDALRYATGEAERCTGDALREMGLRGLSLLQLRGDEGALSMSKADALSAWLTQSCWLDARSSSSLICMSLASGSRDRRREDIRELPFDSALLPDHQLDTLARMPVGC